MSRVRIRRRQAIVDGMKGQFLGGERDRPLTVFDACESHLFRGRQQPAIGDQAGGRVMNATLIPSVYKLSSSYPPEVATG